MPSRVLPDHRYQVDAEDAVNPTDRRSYRERYRSYTKALDRAEEFEPAGTEGRHFAVTIRDRRKDFSEQVIYSA